MTREELRRHQVELFDRFVKREGYVFHAPGIGFVRRYALMDGAPVVEIADLLQPPEPFWRYEPGRKVESLPVIRALLHRVQIVAYEEHYNGYVLRLDGWDDEALEHQRAKLLEMFSWWHR